MPHRIGDRGKATALAGAVRPDDAEDLTRPDLPAHVAQRDQRAILHGQAFDPQHIGRSARGVSSELAKGPSMLVIFGLPEAPEF